MRSNEKRKQTRRGVREPKEVPEREADDSKVQAECRGREREDMLEEELQINHEKRIKGVA